MRRLLALTTLLGGMPVIGAAHAEAPFSFATAPGQLPKNVVPSSYVINLRTDVAKLTLTGDETVTIDVTAPTSDVVINQAGLKLHKAVLDGDQTATISQDESAQTATLHFPGAVSTGKHTLAISYSGPILKTPNGIYIDDYKGADGKARRMIVTQFEVADARRMFPGWDEPAFKATFQLNVSLPFDYAAISNMPIIGTTQSDAKTKRVSFGATPRMSSYLLALVAGDMSSVQGEADGTPIATWAPTGKQDQGQYAVQAASQILPYYNEYFGVKYPLPKLDMLAIPGNYQAGAMENWGALTYIDNALLFDPANSTPRTRETIYSVVAHEMAHQWSGDLVTMAWWDNIWLNEGFATWMQTKVTDKMNPEWDIWPREHHTREATMSSDALPSTHPIQQVIHNVSEADTAFDGISYGKGSLVIRMIEGWLGEDAFRDGMRLYMKAHAYSNTTSQDLWNALSEASKLDVASVAQTFTTQPGIPEVDVASACHGGKTVYTLTQSRFTIHDPHPTAQTWNIPVVAGGPGLKTQKLVLGDKPVKIKVKPCGAPLKLDLGESGYYRVHYDDAAFAALLKAAPSFAAVDRANLLGDQFALFRAGKAPISTYFDLVNVLTAAHESDIAVLSEIISGLDATDTYEIGSPDREAFHAYARSVLAPVFARLGWDPKPGESVLDTILRPSVIGALGDFGDQAVLAEAHTRFQAWKSNPASVRPDLVGVVASIAMRDADLKTWQWMAKKVRDAQSTEVKLRLFGALASVRNPDLIRRNVAFAYSGAIPNGRIEMALSSIAAESEQPDLVWQIVKEHEKDIRSHLAPWSQDGLLPSIAGQSSNPATIEALKSDPSADRTTGAKVETARALDRANSRIETKTVMQTQLHDWLATQNGHVTTP
ncbi:M1 family metallopeptidase [Brytella acorum]|uniref:Aminopeptidase n=1 Tax=Brytella acorum TaxID=2959299 RepID=A0AA35UVM6_9PROT|nr:M1 family metallopeptidase [Brytella acorum]MDF3625450.1 M1 family metallopeptidase [Brytella acorum]CAI9120301.1 M1 family metallopeptidase [Brytella acorum]